VKGKIKYLSKVAGVNIYAGKKTNIVYLDPSRLNLATASAKIQGLGGSAIVFSSLPRRSLQTLSAKLCGHQQLQRRKTNH
jgi:hypothetical protein